MKYSILLSGMITVSCIILAGCGPVTKIEKVPPRKIVTFNYTPPAKTSPDFTGPRATIAVLRPRFSSNSSVTMLKSFAGSIGADLKETLIACGYDVKGPFKTIDGVQGSNGVLLPLIEFDISPNIKSTSAATLADRLYGNPNVYRGKGSVTVNGEISLELVGSPVSEIFSKEIVSIGPVIVDVTSDQVYDWGGFNYQEIVTDIVRRNDKVHSNLERTLKTQYGEVMGTIYHHFRSNEFAELIPRIEPPRTNIIFDYIPATKAPVGSTNITFAVVNTYFETPVPMFKEFAENMTKDFQEILTEKGYHIKGPFKNYDEMIYPDKEGSNLLLEADVKFRSDTSQLRWDNVEVKFESKEAKEYYRASGSITINCHINLILYESLTRERMWTKSLSITPLVVTILSHEMYPSKATLAGQLKEDNQFHADLGKALQSQYNEIMSKIEAYLDPREMKILAKQVQQLRKQKVFQ